jgi:hypothetical protein
VHLSSGSSVSPELIMQNIKNLNNNDLYNTILTHDEPDGTDTTKQGATTVDQALQVWPYVLLSNRRIGSPAMYGSLLNAPVDAPGYGQNLYNTTQPTMDDYKNAGLSLPDLYGEVMINISNNPTQPNIVKLNPLIWLDNFLIKLYIDYINNPTKYPSRKKFGGPFPDFICIHSYTPLICRHIFR